MKTFLSALSLSGVFLCLFAGVAQAQQFRVYTSVKRPALSASEKEETLARSVTLFHAGRVFDWMPSAGEVTIFEPAHERFIIFNGDRRIAASVTFNEIERLLDTARVETFQSIEQLADGQSFRKADIAEPLRFQLDPHFTEKFSATDHILTLSSPKFTYRVQCARPETPEVVDQYLNYTDWLARLNYVLSPGIYPAPRLELNKCLRSRKVVPLRVELSISFDKPHRLEAEHQFGWELQGQDRDNIAHWESLLRDSHLEWLPFRDYQQSVLGKNVPPKSAQVRR